MTQNIIATKGWRKVPPLNLDADLKSVLKEPGHAGDETRKKRLLENLLSDMPRSGVPCTYTAEQYTQIIAVALERPEEQGVPITHWAAREQGDEVRKRGIAPNISNRQVKRFLDKADLKPHKMLYWLNPKIDDFEEFQRRVKMICDIYLSAQELHEEGVHIISTDEKTGIQALERIAAILAMKC